MSKRIKFSCHIRDYRIMSGLTQSDLAKLVGVSKNTVSAWETGLFYPRADKALHLCKIFGCEFMDLFHFIF